MSKSEIKIHELFTKDIKRELNGVIKVEQHDEKNVFTELNEYVITKETLKNLDKFFNSYQKMRTGSTDKVGVWISGFFGSGKSHFLKILGYLLENRKVKGKSALGFFKEKIDDSFLYNRIEDVVNYGTRDVILFNIESKADSMQKEDELVVNILMKAFNEEQGFMAGSFWIADMENDLTSKGLYNDFKNEFTRINGNSWEEKRDLYMFEQDDIIEAFVNINYIKREAAENLFERDGESYTFSIDKFGQKLKDYCKSKGPEHQVIFLVDEMGQYVGDNSKLLLNLQTIVERMGSELQGKVWVVVTSQADIDSTLKNLVKEYDFSKIQARFDTRLALSSANVDEVIKTRILEKKTEYKDTLSSYYAEKSIILKNLLSFSRTGPEMKKYQTEDDFVRVYPFVPYQFILLQKVFDHIRETGFTGKHLAKGERSLLSAFKESTEQYCDHQLGTLIPFSSFYNTIESFLDPIIIKTIEQASYNENLDSYDCDILKLLFLIRNVKIINSNIDNLTILSVINVDEDKKKLRERITNSLQKLETETLIHKAGDNYHFLTNVEQEINKEIKHIDIEEHKIIDELHKELFNNVCPTNYRSYSFNKKIDGKEIGKANADMTVRFITPLFKKGLNNINQISLDGDTLSSIDSSETLLFIFPEDNQTINLVRNYLQIKKYLTQNSSSQHEDEISRIYASKSQEQSSLENSSKQSLTEAIINSRTFIDGKQVSLSTREPKDLIEEGLAKLIQNVYSKASYVTYNFESENNILGLLKGTDLEKFGFGESSTNKMALNELNAYIKRKHDNKSRLLLRDIKERFQRKPYGWKPITISGLVATLFISEKVLLRYQSELLTSDYEKIVRCLTQRTEVDKLIIECREEMDENVIKNVKMILRECYQKIDIPEKETELFTFVRDLLNHEKQELITILARYSEVKVFPGRSEVENYQNFLILTLKYQDPASLFKQLESSKAKLEDAINVVGPVKTFFGSPQVKIFKEAVDNLNRYKRNKQFLEKSIINDIGKVEEIILLNEPYSEIKHLPKLFGIIEKGLETALSVERTQNLEYLEQVKKDIKIRLDIYNELSNEFTISIMNRFDEIENILRNEVDCSLISNQNTHLRKLQEDIINDINEEIHRINGLEKRSDEPVRKTKVLQMDVHLKYNKNINNESELDEYLEYLRGKLLDLLKENDIRLT